MDEAKQDALLFTDLLFGEDAELALGTSLPSTSAHVQTGGKRARESGTKTSSAQLDAQKRWREKQKSAVEEMEAELRLRVQQFDQLSEQNGHLKKKMHILESVLAVREQHLARLTRIQQQDQQQGLQPAQQLPGTSQPGLFSSLNPSDPSAASQSAALASLGSALARTGSQTHAGGSTAHAPLMPAPAPAIQLPDPPAVGEPLGSLAAMPPAPLWDSQWMKRMKEVTPREWQQLWLEFIRDSSMFCLAAEAHGPGSHANERLTQVVSTYLGILDQITLLNPTTYYDSLYINLATGKKEEPAPTHWSAVTRSVLSTPAQVRECMAALRLFDDVMAGVLHERTALAQQVGQAVGTSASTSGSTASVPIQAGPTHIPLPLEGVLGAPSAGNAASSSTRDSQLGSMAVGAVQQGAGALGCVGAAGVPDQGAQGSVVELGQLATRLAQNVAREQQAHNLISDFVVTKVLSVVQVAKAVASSYPYVPDVLAILREGVAMAQAGALGPM